jgi:hypothetical protein
MIRIVRAIPLPDHRLELLFTDGSEGVVDLSGLVGRGVFAAWRDPAVFDAVSIDTQTGTVSWPGGIDLDPDVLYARATGKPIEGADAA